MLFAVIDLLLRATLRVIAMRWASARARLTGADVPNFHAQILLHNAATYRPSVARPWDSKLPPIDYERSCSDQLNPPPKATVCNQAANLSQGRLRQSFQRAQRGS